VVLLLAPVAVAVGAWVLATKVLKKEDKDKGRAGRSPHLETDLASPHAEGEFKRRAPRLDNRAFP